MKSFLFTFITACFAGQAAAQDVRGFDPGTPCVELLAAADGTTDQMMIAAWVMGYLGGASGQALPVTPGNAGIVLENLTQACISSGNATLLELAKQSVPAKVIAPGSEAEARLLLEQFLDPVTDRYALTRALIPKQAEVAEVYEEPLASLMMQLYYEKLVPGVAIGPKEGQSALLVVYSSTKDLREGGRALEEFPGGYERVRAYMKGDHPIVRFKFVKPGERLGMAYDGLVYVNGRWVWMPKPWTALPE